MRRRHLLIAVAGTLSLFGGASGSQVDPDPRALQERALQEMDRGRYWHASLILRSDDDASPFLRARAEAGWGNWDRVWTLLESLGGISPAERAAAHALRARAAQATDRPDEAIQSFRAALDGSTGLSAGEIVVLRSRLARVLAEEGELGPAVNLVDAVADEAPWASSWLALEIAGIAADRGEVESVRMARERIADPDALTDAWALLPRAHLAAGDTAGALDAYLAAARSSYGDGVRSAAWARIGELRRSLDEDGAASQAFRNALGLDRRRDAAAGLVDLGIRTPDEALEIHDILRSSDSERALTALERYAALQGPAEPLPDRLRLSRARLLEGEDRLAEASRELEELTDREDAGIAAPALDLLATIRRRQGLPGEARAFQDLLVRRHPSRSEAVDIVFFRGDGSHDREDWVNALGYYGQAYEMAPEVGRAELARMRMGQIRVTRGELAEAADIYEQYADDHPRGRHWDEARFWAAWTRYALGQAEAARMHVEEIVEGDPLSYYAMLGLELLGESFAPDLPEGPAPPEIPAVEEAVERLVLLREAGLGDRVSRGVEVLARRFDQSDALLRLSLELSERGFSLDGINLAWRVQARGRPWDRWLARAIYPFPYRDLVRLEAEEWGLDPYYLAALIRQESAFLAEARSSAGALGLMQVIPSTGESMARSAGPDDFSARHLLQPEVNLHLGAAFLSQLHRRFGDRVPLVLAAYNAGPTRASQWERRFPEAEDLLRFTERIPYEETRGYVKRVSRNLEVYRWLYAGEE